MFTVSLALLAPAVIGFAPPRAWIAGWGGAPDVPFTADFSGKGQAEMVAFDPRGEGSLHLLPTQEGFKPADGIQMLGDFGRNCQAITVGSPREGEQALVVGLFDGSNLRLAKKDGQYPLKKTDHWVDLPKKVGNPVMAMLDGKAFVFSSKSGEGFAIDLAGKSATAVRVPTGMVWLGDSGADLVGQDAKGNLFWIDRTSLKRKGDLGKESPGSRPAATAGMVMFGDTVWTPTKTFQLEKDMHPMVDVMRTVGRSGKYGRPVVYEWRRGKEVGTGSLVQLRRGILDVDATLKEDDPESDSYNRCSSDDGLLDGWKKFGYRGLDLAKLGCKVGQADVICLISRFENVKPETIDAGIKRITQFYSDLKLKNRDGSTGISFHAMLLDPVSGGDMQQPWWNNRAKFLPEKWRGIVHWMQVTQGGGGQSNELSDGGTCGENALWAVFVHEFGHQLGLNHEGFSPGYASPFYTSLMNYTYSYRFEDTINKVHYSDGKFSSLKLRESDLDETLAFPYDEVKFLAKGPYHFPIKANGGTTLVDWNRNGVWGEKHVRASITYAYSIGGGTRDDLEKSRTKTAPWLFEHKGQAYLLYGTNDLPIDKKVDPSLSPERPGRLVLRQMVKRKQWTPETLVELGGVTGDPVAVSYGGKILAVYPSASGILARWITPQKDGFQMSNPVVIEPDKTLVPTVANYEGRAYVFLQNPTTLKLTYRIFEKGAWLKDDKSFDFPSSNPVGMCTDTKNGEAIMALGQNQDNGRLFRWQYRRFKAEADGTLTQTAGPIWVDGEKGGTRGQSRLTPLFDASKDGGPNGRVIIIGKGLSSEQSPWSCCYQAHEIADPKFNGGWLVKRYYDEWTQSRSAPAAMWFGNDMLYAYRWVDGGQGATDNTLHVAYRGSGLQTAVLSDFDDITYVRTFGLANSIPVLGRG